MSEWIDREDMLELTRRMTPSRTHFTRLAGAYMDEEGYVDGTFNSHFLKLSPQEKTRMLEIAREVIISETNKELIQHKMSASAPGNERQLLEAMIDCGLKNDALMLTFYEMLGERLKMLQPYAIYVFHGVYDVPVKANDKVRLDESEEVYAYLLTAICPLKDDEPEPPVYGFLYPAFSGRSSDQEHINIFRKNV